MNEQEYDQLLGIETGGIQEWPLQLAHYNRYEATPYEALDILFEEYELGQADQIVDFGCGKGRLLFYVHHNFSLPGTGIEVNHQLYETAIQNLQSYKKKGKVSREPIRFTCLPAEKYQPDPADNQFYFFNPFSIQIFMKVVSHILQSIKERERSVDLILYYPSIDYIQFLDMKTPFVLVKEVPIPGLYEKNENERFLVYTLS